MQDNKGTRKFFQSRFSPVTVGIIILCLTSLLTRIILLVASSGGVDWTFLNLSGIFLIGLLFDVAVAFYAFIPLVLYIWLIPDKLYKKRFNKILLHAYFFVVIATLLFNAVSEWFFWQEFSVRYNFIAVDYLVYTNEVIGNIRQSYPVNTILFVLALVSAFLLYLLSPLIWNPLRKEVKFRQRTPIALLLLSIPVISFFCLNHKWKNFSSNQYVNELAGNGMFDFGFAFWNNELDYDTFYKTIPVAEAENTVGKELGVTGTGPNGAGSFTLRKIGYPGSERKMNVVLISIESMSADFLGSFGNTKQITPNMDSLAKNGLLFTNLYASGTRTVRGLEALSLSIPPTPGQSIVKRPDNSGLFSLGSVFHSKGYNSRFIYGGYGYFDNMNTFFSGNGYTVTDRKAINDKDIHYQNIWGVADEDLFTLSLRLFDGDFKNKKPFFAHIMTVSNHRPYTYPEGRIDIPSHTGRDGAVKYTDYAIGKFMREAASKPWFNNTLFVITADHCASSAGKVELPVNKYHIPMIFYSPGNLKPGSFDNLTSQIDVAPTILGFLNFHYTSKFFGRDAFRTKSGEERAFISTYQSLGFIKNNKLVILEPNKRSKTFIPDFKSGDAREIKADPSLTKEAISNYQLASYLYKNHLYKFTR